MGWLEQSVLLLNLDYKLVDLLVFESMLQKKTFSVYFLTISPSKSISLGYWSMMAVTDNLSSVINARRIWYVSARASMIFDLFIELGLARRIQVT
jgi:hypothetical protein